MSIRTVLLDGALDGRRWHVVLGLETPFRMAAIAAIAPAAFLMNQDRVEILFKLNYDYQEIPGATRSSVIEQGMPDIFTFFKAHPKIDAK